MAADSGYVIIYFQGAVLSVKYVEVVFHICSLCLWEAACSIFSLKISTLALRKNAEGYSMITLIYLCMV